jgi:hypothetical protein
MDTVARCRCGSPIRDLEPVAGFPDLAVPPRNPGVDHDVLSASRPSGELAIEGVPGERTLHGDELREYPKYFAPIR